MSVETITLQLPESLARELSAASQALLLNIFERGLRELKIDQALEQYRRGASRLVPPPNRPESPRVSWLVKPMLAAWNHPLAQKRWQRSWGKPLNESYLHR